MAVKQSAWAQGRRVAAVAGSSGTVVAQKFKIVIDEDLAIGDIVEFGVLPNYHDVVDMKVVNAALGAGVTGDVGIMTGDYGDPDQARDSGNEFFAAADLAAAAVTRMTKPEGFLLTRTDKERGLGLKIGGAAVTATGQEVTVIVEYRQ